MEKKNLIKGNEQILAESPLFPINQPYQQTPPSKLVSISISLQIRLNSLSPT